MLRAWTVACSANIIKSYVTHYAQHATRRRNQNHDDICDSSIPYSIWNSNVHHSFRDESHNLLTARLSRTRRDDPVMTHQFTTPLSHFYASDKPDLNASSDDIVLVASVEAMEQFCLPMIQEQIFSYRCISVS